MVSLSSLRCWPIFLSVFLLLLTLQAVHTDTCDPHQLAVAIKERDDCQKSLQKADESCEGSNVVKNLRETVKKKDEALSENRKINSEMNSELLECQETIHKDKSELEQHAKKKTLLEKRLKDAKDKLTACMDKVDAIGPDDATAAQQEIIYLKGQIKTLQTSNDDRGKKIETLQNDLNELRIRDAICQTNYTHLMVEHSRCNVTQTGVSQDYEIYRTLVEKKNVILAIVGTALIGLLVMFLGYGRGHHGIPPPPPLPPLPEELRRRLHNEIPAITAQGMPGVAGLRAPQKFDVTLICPKNEAHQVWVQEIERQFLGLGVTVNPNKPTDYDSMFPPPSTSVIILSEKPGGSKFFCVNQVKKEFFHISDNEELLEYAKKKYQRSY